MAEEDSYPFKYADDEGIDEVVKFNEDANVEVAILFGSPFYYIKREIAGTEPVFGEHLHNVLRKAVKINFIVENPNDDLEMESMYTKFGVKVEAADMTLWGVKRLLAEKGVVPKEGDLIWYPRLKKLYEVSLVDLKENIKYKILCSLHTPDHTEIEEDFNIPAIKDKLEALDDVEQANFFDPIDGLKNEFIDDAEVDPLAF